MKLSFAVGKSMTLLGVFACLLPACKASEEEAFAACRTVIESGEKYASTLMPIIQSAEYKALTRDEFASELVGSALTPTNFAKIESTVQSAPEVDLSAIESFPSGSGFEQASYLKIWANALKDALDPGLQNVQIEYDVDNGNGVPERKSATCAFAVSDVSAKAPLLPYGEMARLEKLRRRTFGFDPVPNKGFGCCIPRFAFSKVTPSSAHMTIDDIEGQPVKGGVVMYDEIEAEVKKARAYIEAQGRGAN